MTVVLSIADQGFEVALVEREEVLGGNLRSLTRRPDGRKVNEYLDELISRMEDHPVITVYLNSTVFAINVYIGNYLTFIEKSDTWETEEYYQQARYIGVIFIRYEEDKKPLVRYIKDGEDKKIAVSVRDHVLDTDIEIASDRVILASAMEPQKDAERLS